MSIPRNGAAVAACCVAAASAALAAVPARTGSGQTLEVPEAHATQGAVYYVEGGHDSQVTFTSDAPVERIVGTSGSVVGYVVVPEESASTPIVAGAFRLPVASLDTGIPLRNEHLQGARWFDAERHPDITFEIVGAEAAGPATENADTGVRTHSVMLNGDLTIKGVTKRIEVPAKITLIPSDQIGTRARGRSGDVLALKCGYSVNLHDFNIGDGMPMVGGPQVAEDVEIEQFLLFTTVNPDALTPQLAGRFGLDEAGMKRLMRFQTLLLNERRPDEAYEIAWELIDGPCKDNAQALNVLANIAVSDGAAKTDYRFAKAAAMRAVDASGGEDPMILDTVADLHYRTGDLDAAVKWQRKAVEHVDAAPANLQSQIKGRLEKYQSEAGAG